MAHQLHDCSCPPPLSGGWVVWFLLLDSAGICCVCRHLRGFRVFLEIISTTSFLIPRLPPCEEDTVASLQLTSWQSCVSGSIFAVIYGDTFVLSLTVITLEVPTFCRAQFGTSATRGSFQNDIRCGETTQTFEFPGVPEKICLGRTSKAQRIVHRHFIILAMHLTKNYWCVSVFLHLAKLLKKDKASPKRNTYLKNNSILRSETWF